ncbi:MAG TPA: hypothetical protein VIV57_25935 [Anaeromyxobacter sp.]
MSEAIAGGRQPRISSLWARLEISAVGMMAVGMVLCALPLLRISASDALEDALAATGNAFAAFILGELLCVPFASWFGEKRSRGLARPLGAALGLVSALAGVSASSAAARVAWYALAGVGAETAQAWIMGNAVRSPLLRRGPELLALLATCAVVLALELGLYLVASGPPQGIRTVVVCCAGQATVILLAVLYALYPPPPSTLPLG